MLQRNNAVDWDQKMLAKKVLFIMQSATVALRLNAASR